MKDLQDYLIQFVETKQEIFNNFPVCPFAKRERIENKIKFVECSFKNIDTTKIIDETHNWLNGDYSTLLYVDIGDADFIETNHFHRCIDALTDKEDVNTFLFHKESKRKFGGMYTRRSPRPFIMIGYKDHIGEKKKQLLKTKYYDKLNNEEYGILNSKRKRKNAKNRESNSENS